MARLSYSQRKKMPTSSFAVPSTRKGGKGGYPIPDISHARNARARASQFGSPAVKAQVFRKTAARFPSLQKVNV